MTHPTDRAEAMREACAKVCEENGVVTTPQGKRLAPDRYKPTGAVHEGMVYAAAIRAIPLPARDDAVEEAMYRNALACAAVPLEVLAATECDDAGTALAPTTKAAVLRAVEAVRAALRREKGGGK